MLLSLIISIVILYLITHSIYALLKARYSALAKIPGFQLYNPFLGNLWTLYQTPAFERWENNVNRFGPVYRWHSAMGHPFITVTSSEYIKHILSSKNYIRGVLTGVEVFRKIVGDHSMLIIEGDQHRRHRSIVSPAFRISNLRKLVPVMERCSLMLCDHFDHLLRKNNVEILERVNIRVHLSHVTLTVIGLTGFGFNFDCIRGPNRFAEMVSKLTGSDSKYGILQMMPYAYYYPLPSVQKLWSSLKAIHAVIDDMVKKKLRYRGENEKNLLDMILDHSEAVSSTDNGLSENELRDEVMTFIMAGHETSSLALTWALAMLCLHPNWQDSCRDEIRKVLKDDKKLNWDQLEQLKLTKAVVLETMRLWPPVPTLSRKSIHDDNLGRYFIPAGTSILCQFGQMQRTSTYWPKPKEFKPERFLEEDVPWEAYMPFGDGIHKCLGYQFATAEIITVLATLLGKYKFRLAMNWEDLELRAMVTLQPTKPILVDIEPAM